MRRLGPAVAVVVSVLAAGCGGSSSTSSSTSSTHSSSSSGSGSGSSSGAASGPVGNSVTANITAGTASSTSSTSTAAADTGVRLPARFTIRDGGTLLPSAISAPKRTAVALTVVSEDGRAHAVVLQTPQRHTASVGPGRPLRLLLRGLPDGTYAVQIDGRVRGRLVIGATPGP